MANSNQTQTKARSNIEKQAIELIVEDADIIGLVTGIDFTLYRSQGDTYDEWHASYPFEPMLRALYLKDLMGYSDTDLHRRLTENSEEATALGFESVPSRTTFIRTWRNRLSDELRTQVQHTTHRILEYAHEQGNPIGLRSLETEDKSDVSKRTEDRVIRKKSIEAAQDLRELLYGAIDLQRPDTGTQYATTEFLGLESLLCSETCAAEQGSEIYGDHAPKGVSVPEGETLLHYIKQLDVEDVFEVIQQGVDVQLKTARRHLEFERPVDLAIDMTYVAYYSDDHEALNYGDDEAVVLGAPPSKGFDWCFKFATACIVGDNPRFMIAVRPHTKGQTIGELVREVYWEAAEHVSIQTVYADAEFYSADAIHSLEETGSTYVIRVPENARVKRQIERADHDVWVKDEHAIYGSTEGGSTNSRVETTHVGVPKNINPEETVVFATNDDLDDEIELDRREAKRRINRYRRRWGIETSFASLKDFLPYTTSKEYPVRLFHFGFGMLVYNMWLLVDFLIQLSLDGEQRTKPRLKAKRFLRLVESVLRMYG